MHKHRSTYAYTHLCTDIVIHTRTLTNIHKLWCPHNYAHTLQHIHTHCRICISIEAHTHTICTYTTFIHTHCNTYTHTDEHAQTLMHIHIHTPMNTHWNTHIDDYIHSDSHVHTLTHVRTNWCTYTHICAHTDTYIHTLIHITCTQLQLPIWVEIHLHLLAHTNIWACTCQLTQSYLSLYCWMHKSTYVATTIYSKQQSRCGL